MRRDLFFLRRSLSQALLFLVVLLWDFYYFFSLPVHFDLRARSLLFLCFFHLVDFRS